MKGVFQMENLKIALGNKDLGRAIDIGTRRGEFLFRMKDYSRSYEKLIGIDINTDELDKLKFKEEKNIRFHFMNAYDLEYPDGYFGAVSISNTLHHLNDMEGVLNEMTRVLKDDGYFLINEMFHDCDDNSKKTHGMLHILEAEIDTELGRIHNKTFEKEEIIKVASDLNLRSLEIVEYSETFEFDKKIEKKLGKLDGILASVSGYPKYEYFCDCVDKIRKNYDNYGVKRCTQLLVIGRK
jgi:ubiquinone/menaquinone biosynthesis C-methylase UbiE